ncbi:hypothetical protein ASALC70_03730 [Alcanivorax sp. ALC70]|nr:hypothetical protein ASALC70_03730 [Alcanivorax sp. ALC70]
MVQPGGAADAVHPGVGGAAPDRQRRLRGRGLELRHRHRRSWLPAGGRRRGLATLGGRRPADPVGPAPGRAHSFPGGRRGQRGRSLRRHARAPGRRRPAGVPAGVLGPGRARLGVLPAVLGDWPPAGFHSPVRQPGSGGGCGGDRRRGSGRPPAGALQGAPGQPRPHLPGRSVALFPPPQLFLRMAALVQLPADRRGGGAPRRLAVAPAGGHVPVPVVCHRHSLHRKAGAEIPWRRLPRVSAHHQPLHSLETRA